MLTFSALGAAALAKLLAIKEVVGRFLNGSAVAAVAIVTAGLVVLVGGIMLVHTIRSGAAAAAVAGWQSKFAMSRYVATLRERKLQRDADERAAAERQVLVEQIRETAEHAANLERALARETENPVCYTPEITRELRK